MQVLAIDLGASNGRAIVGEYRDGGIFLNEIHRFENEPVKLGKYLYWDFPYLFKQIKKSLVKAHNQGFEIKSIAVDSWGVDYGLIDEEGQLLSNPINYRDDRSVKGLEKLLSLYSYEELKEMTYMNSESYNTVNQLLMDYNSTKAKSLLFTPDLFNYFLSGKKRCEYSMASTSQLIDYGSLDWNRDFIKELKIKDEIFGEITKPMCVVGELKNDIADELGIEKVKVVSITGHDTHVALKSIPVKEDDFIFISAGTWVVVGSKQTKATYNEMLVEYNLSNEGGSYPDVNILKNIVGLWIIQRTKKYYNDRGKDYDFPYLIEAGEKSTIDSLIDINDSRFFGMGNMPELIDEYLKEKGQDLPKTVGDYIRIIERSLAKEISKTINNIEKTVGKSYDKVYMFGGGLRDRLLKKFIKEFSGKEILEGVIEGTATGNVLEQLITLGAIKEEERVEVIIRTMERNK